MLRVEVRDPCGKWLLGHLVVLKLNKEVFLWVPAYSEPYFSVNFQRFLQNLAQKY